MTEQNVKPRVAAAIVTYNHKNAVLTLLDYLKKQSIPAFVTENDCRDGTVDAIKHSFPDVSLLESPANLGGCGGFNCSLLAALSSGCDYIALLDDDVLPDGDCLERLADFLDEHDEYVFAAPAIYISSKPDTLQETGGGIDFRRSLPVQAWNRFEVNPELPEHIDIDYASACCLLVRADVVSQIGVMDWNYFIFSDDVDFSIRLQRETGKKAVCLTRAKAYHDFPWSKPFSPMRLYFFMRNGLYMLSKLRQGKRSVKTLQTAVMRILRRWFYSSTIGDFEIAQTLRDVFFDSWHRRYGKWQEPVQFGASRRRLDKTVLRDRKISKVLLDITIEDFDLQAVKQIQNCAGQDIQIDILCDQHRQDAYGGKECFKKVYGRTPGRLLGPVIDFFRMRRHKYDLVVTDASMEPRRPSSMSGRYAAFFHNEALYDAASPGLWSCFTHLAGTALAVVLSMVLFLRFLRRPTPGVPPEEAAPVLEVIGVDPLVGQPWARSWPVPFSAGRHGRSCNDEADGDYRPPVQPLSLREGEEGGGYNYWCRMRDRIAPDYYGSITKGPLFSIVVPVCDTPRQWLQECIDSVLSQTYPHWQLILSDDASEKEYIKEIMERAKGRDNRISLIFSEKRGGISAATNKAAKNADGDYLIFLDHDDILDPHVLAAIVNVLNQKGEADIIYADEDRFDENHKRLQPGFKPAFSPEKLLATNYIHHPVVIRRRLFEQLGGLRSEFDGSQDYDLLLRATENNEKVLHVPDVLYHMRIHHGSLAAGPKAKPKAHDRGRAAVREALSRRGIEADVVALPEPGLNRIVRHLHTMPAVSVIVVAEDETPLRTLQEVWQGCECLLAAYQNKKPAQEINAMAEVAAGDILIIAGSKVRPLSGWQRALVPHVVRPEIGLVGGRLTDSENRLISSGLVLGVAGAAGRWHHGCNASDCGYGGWMMIDHEVSAVPWHFMGINRDLFLELGGFDEDFKQNGFDIDLALRLTEEKGVRHLCIAGAEAKMISTIVDESLDKWHEEDLVLLWKKWGRVIRQGDPFYNLNLTLNSERVFFSAECEREMRLRGYFMAYDTLTTKLFGHKFYERIM